jgi:hypothetical protein
MPRGFSGFDKILLKVQDVGSQYPLHFHERRRTMAKEGPTPNCVSGFVKRTRIQKGDKKMLSFVVADTTFWLPYNSTFAGIIQKAKNEDQNVLLLFREMDGAAPDVNGIIVSPKWAERKAAEDGATSIDEINAIVAQKASQIPLPDQ